MKKAGESLFRVSSGSLICSLMAVGSFVIFSMLYVIPGDDLNSYYYPVVETAFTSPSEYYSRDTVREIPVDMNVRQMNFTVPDSCYYDLYPKRFLRFPFGKGSYVTGPSEIRDPLILGEKPTDEEWEGLFPEKGLRKPTFWDLTWGAMAWLAMNQNTAGFWGDEKKPGESEIENTAYVLLAFSDWGYTHRAGKYREKIQKGIEWLLSKQREDGLWSDSVITNSICLHAFTNLYCMTRKGEYLKTAAIKSAKSLLSFQKEGGSWSESINGGETDSISTCWSIYSLFYFNEAMQMEIVSKDAFSKSETWLRNVECTGDLEIASMVFGCLAAIKPWQNDEPAVKFAEFLKSSINLGEVDSGYDYLYFQLRGFYIYNPNDRYCTSLWDNIRLKLEKKVQKGSMRKIYFWPSEKSTVLADIRETARVVRVYSALQGYRPFVIIKHNKDITD